MKYLNRITTVVYAIPFVFISCVNLDSAEFNTTDTKNFFKTEEDIQAAIVTVYDALAKGPYSDNEGGGLDGSVYDLSKIVFEDGTHTQWGAKGLGRNDFTSSHKYIERMYLGAYFGISKANLVLEKVEEIEMSQQAKDHYIAETRFLRALFYFNLVQYYGGVPIVTEVFDYEYASMIVPRATIKEVYDFIIADFVFAESHLPQQDFIGDFSTGRATALAASGLLAKVWLTRGGYPLNEGISAFEKAKIYAEKVINSGEFFLQDDYGKVFTPDTKNNREWLFSIQFGPENNDKGNWGGHHNAPESDRLYEFVYTPEFGAGYGRSRPSQEMVEAWHPEDPRRVYNILVEGRVKKGVFVENPSWKWRMRKFRFTELIASKNQTAVNGPVLRYADILLTLAEVENELNNGPTNLAYQLINQIRARARKGIPSDIESENPPSSEPRDLQPNIDFVDYESFKENLFWERARELCWEGNDRFDLVRSGKYMDYTSNASHLKSNGGDNSVLDPLPHFQLLPLPIIAIRNNPALEGKQNPGY